MDRRRNRKLSRLNNNLENNVAAAAEEVKIDEQPAVEPPKQEEKPQEIKKRDLFKIYEENQHEEDTPKIGHICEDKIIKEEIKDSNEIILRR